MNKDSSRSHSLLIIYLIKEYIDRNDKIVRGYGKVTFVDLAGSERLKESQTDG